MLLKMEKEKRKQKYLPISSEELNEFSKEVTKNKKLLETELGLKKKQMEEIWKERKNLLPKHHSKFMDLNIEYDKENEDIQEQNENKDDEDKYDNSNNEDNDEKERSQGKFKAIDEFLDNLDRVKEIKKIKRKYKYNVMKIKNK